MGKLTKNDQEIATLEYCLDQYFGKYIGPVYKKGLSDVRSKADNEVWDDLIRHKKNTLALSATDDGAGDLAQMIHTRQTGKWNTIDFSTFANYVSKRFSSDGRIQSDLIRLAHLYRQAMIDKMGKAKYDRLCLDLGDGNGPADAAFGYIQEKLRDLTIRTLSDQDVPKSQIDYVFKRGFEDSLVKGFFNLSINPSSDFLSSIRTHRLDNYKANWFSKLGANGVSSILDAPMLGTYGKVGSVAKQVGIDIAFRRSTEVYSENDNMKGVFTSSLVPFIGPGLAAYRYAQNKVENRNKPTTVLEMYSKAISGDKSYLTSLGASRSSLSSHPSYYLSAVNHSLRNKIPERLDTSRIQATRNLLLNRYMGDGRHAFNTTVATLNNYHIKGYKTGSAPQWMNKLSKTDCIHYSANFLAVAIRMAKQHQDVTYFGNRKMTLQQVAQRAYDYSHAAATKQVSAPAVVAKAKMSQTSVQTKAVSSHVNNHHASPKIDYQLIRNRREYDIISIAGNKVDTTRSTPSWMHNMKKQECLRLGNFYYNRATWAIQHHAKGASVNGTWISTTNLLQRSMDYYNAASCKDHHARSQRTASRQQSSPSEHIPSSVRKPTEHKSHLSNNNMSAAPVSRSHEENNNIGSSVPPQGKNDNYYSPSAALQQPQPAPVNHNVSGWDKMLSNAGLSGFSEVTDNLGYVIAMLPDMLVGMFTGKTKDFRMENNLLPIAAIFGGMFIKNPLLKMLMVGLGGASIFNSAGHEALGIPKQNQVYRKYPDEPLSSRLANPAIKGSSLFVDIDDSPMVINISRQAAFAYQEGYLPLNTLANSVLRKYDEQKQTAEVNYSINNTTEKDLERQVALR